MPRKVCMYCKKRKNLKSFPKHISHKDNLDSRCRSCIKKHTKIRNKLHKKAPPKPNDCECCHILPKKWVLDHNHTNNSFRGWLCDRCNTGLGKFDDNIDGIINALEYLCQKDGLNENQKYRLIKIISTHIVAEHLNKLQLDGLTSR
jgi:hypothetical protein